MNYFSKHLGHPVNELLSFNVGMLLNDQCRSLVGEIIKYQKGLEKIYKADPSIAVVNPFQSPTQDSPSIESRFNPQEKDKTGLHIISEEIQRHLVVLRNELDTAQNLKNLTSENKAMIILKRLESSMDKIKDSSGKMVNKICEDEAKTLNQKVQKQNSKKNAL